MGGVLPITQRFVWQVCIVPLKENCYKAQKLQQWHSAERRWMLASEPDCPGDGNKDGVVNAEDLSNWGRIAHAWGLSSVYDFMVNNVFDGLTNTVDEDIIQNNLGKTCASAHAIY